MGHVQWTPPPHTHTAQEGRTRLNALLLPSTVLDDLMFELVFCARAEEVHAMCMGTMPHSHICMEHLSCAIGVPVAP